MNKLAKLGLLASTSYVVWSYGALAQQIPSFPSATTPFSGGEQTYLVQGGASKNMTLNQLATWAGPTTPNTTSLRLACTSATSCPSGDPIYASGVVRITDGIANSPRMAYIPDTQSICSVDTSGQCIASANSAFWIWQPDGYINALQNGAVITASGGYASPPVDPASLHDDTSAIQAAINTGQTIYLPPGRYHITGPLTCGGNNQRIIGAGKLETLWDVGSDFNMSASGVFNPSPALAAQGGCHLENIGIEFYQSPNAVATFTGSVSGTVLTITSFTSGSGALASGQFLGDTSPNVVKGRLGSQISGAAGGTGTYNVSISQTVSSETMIAMSLIQYPWAIWNSNQGTRFTLDNFAIYRAWNGVIASGNFAPIFNGIIQLGAWNTPLILDGGLDYTFMNQVEIWDFGAGSSNNLTSIWEANPPMSEIGYVDGLEVNSMSLFDAGLTFLPDATYVTGYQFGNLHLNGASSGAAIIVNAGGIEIANLSLDEDNSALIVQGPYDKTTVTIGNCKCITSSTNGYITNHGGQLNILGGSFYFANLGANYLPFIYADSNTGTSRTMIENILIHPDTVNKAHAPLVVTSGNGGIFLDNWNLGASNPGSATAAPIQIGADLTQNYVNHMQLRGWGSAPISISLNPSGVLGYYNIPDISFPISFTPQFVTNGTFSPSGNTSAGFYKLMGDTVFFQGSDQFSTNAYASAAGGFSLATNLPLAASVGGIGTSPVSLGAWSLPTLSASGSLVAELSYVNPIAIFPEQVRSNQTWSQLGPTNFPASTGVFFFRLSGTYAIH